MKSRVEHLDTRTESPIRLGVYWQHELLAVILCDDCDDLIEWREWIEPCELFEMVLRPNATLPLKLETDS